VIPFAYNVRSLRVRVRTTIAAALGVGLVVFVFAVVMMLSNGVRQATRRSADPSGAIVLRDGAATEIESTFDASAVARIAAADGVARAADGRPLVVGELIVLVILDNPSGGATNVQVRGIPDNAMTFRPGVRVVAGRAPRAGTDEAMVGSAIRGRFTGLEIGQRLELQKNRPIEIVGVFDDGGSSYASEVWADAGLVRRTFGQSGVVSSVRVRLTSSEAFAAFSGAIENARELGVAAFRQDVYSERQTSGTATFLTALGFLIAVMFSIGAIIGAMITMHAVISERRREIGTLMALGFTRVQVLAAFLLESIVLALAGGFVGAIAALLMSNTRISMLNTFTWAELAFAAEPSLPILVSAIGIATVMGVLGGLLPAIRATRVDPAQAMRGG
jgi:putative ABC transport system permease protein